MPFQEHRLRAGSRSPLRARSQLTIFSVVSSDTSISSPPSRRMRSDIISSNSGRCGGPAPATPSLSMPPRANTKTAAAAAPVQPCLRSKSATHRRAAVPMLSAKCSHDNRSGRAEGDDAHIEHQRQPPQPRSRRGEDVRDVGSILATERLVQRTRAYKVNSSAPSARRAATAATSLATAVASSQPLQPSSSTSTTAAAAGSATSMSSFAGLTNHQSLQRVRKSGVAPATAGGDPSGSPTVAVSERRGSSSIGGHGHATIVVHPKEGEVPTPRVSPPATCIPPRSGTQISNSCTLPTMPSQTWMQMTSSSCEVTSFNPNLSSCVAPQLTRFAQPALSPLCSSLESFSPPMPRIATPSQVLPAFPAAASSNVSDSTLTDSTITSQGGGCFSWSPSGSMSDDVSTQPPQLRGPPTTRTSGVEARRACSPPFPPSTAHSCGNATRHSAILAFTYPAPVAASAAVAVAGVAPSPSGKAQLNSALLPSFSSASYTTAAPPALSHDRAKTSGEQPPYTAEPQPSTLLAPQTTVEDVPAQRALTRSSSANFNASSIGSSTGVINGAAVVRPPPACDAAAASTGVSATDVLSALQQQHSPPCAQKPASSGKTARSVVAARDPHTVASVSPNPLRPPRVNGSFSSDRRPLVGATASSNKASTPTSTSAVRAISKSPTGTLSAESAKKAMRDRRRRELYAWNEMLRKKNEEGVQDAV
ncbi:hypothetical protein ABL78_3353 [Leptomonas seymouri]|uniref:Uncharacterized protein n=1 Tax=Leptomonas seymouri TaxID=5684 RepID=A0A0N0P6E8_LEPSE|nr:hypothetical protein ABL78_3353 [Leptomonas seymouri]|eukprot:KPI87556.1 hypothetical protein ABL78_3353 [Leptomonas seymouri]